MKINSISVTNLKSFKSTTKIDFDKLFNVIIGPNASGKSNLLDIIHIGLRRYFLKPFQLSASGNGKPTLTAVNFDSDFILDKYVGNPAPSGLIFEFKVTKEDISNIKVLKERKSEIVETITDQTSDTAIVSILQNTDWDEKIFSIGDLLSYTIADGVLQNEPITYPNNGGLPKLTARQIFLTYLNNINAVRMLAQESLKIELSNSLLFISPYRSANNNQDFSGILSSYSSIVLSTQLMQSTSKKTTSLIKMASTYFAEKLRGFESISRTEGFEKMWNDDLEVKLISRYLRKLGYSWNMKLKNALNNTYEIELEKSGQKLSLSQASSGEKEIINYLFGIFALKITNGIIVVDEPELHLHPRWQMLLLDLFQELAKETGNQFMITTHSPVFINVNTVSNLIRVYRKNNESFHVSLINSPSSPLKDLLHLVNSTNNEKVFFADLVILVEGVTDHLVFQRIFSYLLEKNNILSAVEVVEIKGKGNIKKFRNYLNKLEIPYFFIADLDYVHEVGSEAVHNLFDTDLGAVDSNAIKNGRSSDGKKLIELLEESLESEKYDEVKLFLEYMKSFRKKLRDNLSAPERKILHDFIEDQHGKHEYILEDGAIEKYFPENVSKKDLDNVINLLTEERFAEWQTTSQYMKLEYIALDILKKAGLII